MRKKSAAGADIYYELWKTPLTKKRRLWLNAVFQTEGDIHFFFEFKVGKDIRIVVLTIDRLSPYRLIEEQYAVGCIGKLLVPQRKTIMKFTGSPKRCWKLWGTPFIKEVDQNHALSGYAKKQDKNIAQYLIITDDEYIEFILRRPPVWKTYKNMTTEKLIAKYAKGKFSDS